MRVPIQSRLAPFSTSLAARAKASGRDNELANKLGSELKMEQDMDENLEPTCIKDYINNSPFEVIDVPGHEEVILKRTYGQEKIQISFSVNDLNMDPEFNEPPPYEDEEEEGEDNSEQKNPEDDYNDNSIPTRLQIVIEKPSKGALAIEAGAEDGCIVIDHVFHCKDAEQAYAKTPEALKQRQELYLGPTFQNLDENLQVLFDKYLDERGINNALATFIPEYQTMKEQKEYLRWLETIQKFVES
ncbi:hypothetical protein K3495_g5057 [Podosphaera aphanis]|nr:hypothetical protein K3495_g5057 [Podosphaera aphanis]